MSVVPRFRLLTGVTLVVVLLGACSFNFSLGGGLDYAVLEEAISEELNTTYADIGRSVSAVNCPELADSPEPGDTLICTAELEGQDVRVETTVEDEDFNVTFSTLDTVYELADTAALLASDISEQIGVAVNVNCGDGFTVVANGDTFDCTGIDENSETATIRVTANGPDDASWEILE